MNLATVIGHATSTVKHESLNGWKLLAVQPLDMAGNADGQPLIVLDELGCGKGDQVIITCDSVMVREMVGSNNTPARWAVMGLAD